MAGVTALWHLEKKPTIPMVNPTGSLTLLFQLLSRADCMAPHETMSDSPVDAPEEP